MGLLIFRVYEGSKMRFAGEGRKESYINSASY